MAVAARLLVVHDPETGSESLVGQLRSARYEVDVADGVGPACFMLRRTDYTAVIADLPAADSGALAILRAAGRSHPAARVILTLPAMANTPEPALPELSRAAYRCLRHPVALDDELMPVVREAIVDHRSEAERPVRMPYPRAYMHQGAVGSDARRGGPRAPTGVGVPRSVGGAPASASCRDGQRNRSCLWYRGRIG